MKKKLLILAGFAIFNTCISQSNNTNNQVFGGGNSSSIDFDGIDDHITTSTVLNSTTFSSWTIECWAKSPSAPGSSLGLDGPIYGENAGILWNHSSSNYQGVGMVRDVNGNYFSASFGALLPNTWYHLAVTYDGNALKAYRNGSLITTTSTNSGGMINSASQLFFGRHPNQGYYWQGSIDDARIWSIARTCEEISAGMNNYILSGTGLVASYTFNEGVTNGSNTSLFAVQNSVTLTSDASLTGFALTGASSNFVSSAPFNLPLVCAPSSGLPANSLSFGGTNDLVVVPNTTPFTDYTIECNVLLNSLADQNIIVATNASGTNASASHQIKLVNSHFVHYTYDGNLRTLISTATVNINQWYHVSIFVRAGQAMGINVDGIVDYYPTTVNTPWQLLTEFRFGGSAMGVGDFNGKLDEVRIWDRVLSIPEMQHYSNCEVSFPTSGLRSVFHFNQGIEVANNTGIDSLFAENSSLVGTLVGFTLNGNGSNWDDGGLITTGNTCSNYIAANATSLNFDGVDDFVNFATNPDHELSTGTVEAWIKTNDLSTGYKAIVAKVNAYGIFLRYNSLAVYDWSTSAEIIVGNPINDNQWHHVAFVFKSGVTNGSQLYLDGFAVGSPFTYTIQNQFYPLCIGGNLLASNQNFKGSVDEVRVWNRALCPVEILANKSCNIPSATSGLISAYHFDQGLDAENNVTEYNLINGSGMGSSHGSLQGFTLISSTSNWLADSPFSAATCNSFYTGVIQNGVNLESVVSGGGITYQWYDCGTGNIIPGETNMVYTPTTSGSYRVLLTVSGCSIMSDCITYTSVGLNSIESVKNEMLVYPNPAQDKLTIKAEGKSLKVFNSLGVVVLTSSLTKGKSELQLNDLNAGVYYIVTDLGVTTKFIKQ